MNKLLAKLLGILNGLIALIFIVAGAAAGYAVSEGTGLILGLLGGMIFAIFFCGYAAIFEIDKKTLQKTDHHHGADHWPRSALFLLLNLQYQSCFDWSYSPHRKLTRG